MAIQPNRKYTTWMTGAFSDDYFSERLAASTLRESMYKSDQSWLLKYFKKNEPLSILDIGCADGKFTSLLSTIGIPYGVEINAAQRRSAESTYNLTVFESLEHAAASNLEFDCILLRGTLHHLSEAEIDFVIDLDPRYIVFLQSINTKSLAIRAIGADAFKVIYPDVFTKQKVYLDSHIYIENKMKLGNYKKTAINFPYISTPYKKPLRDFSAFLRSWLFIKPLPSSFTNALPGVIFRAIYSK